jgi:hypothetical protein
MKDHGASRHSIYCGGIAAGSGILLRLYLVTAYNNYSGGGLRDIHIPKKLITIIVFRLFYFW